MSHRKAQNLEIDNLDIQILSILMKNATTPHTSTALENVRLLLNKLIRN